MFGSVSYKVVPGHALHRCDEAPVIMSGKNNCISLRVFWQTCWEWRCLCSSLRWFCSTASADCSCRVSGPPAQPVFYEVRITQHKNIIHIGRRARPRQCGCGGWRAASCGWAREKAGPRTCKYAKCRHHHRHGRRPHRRAAACVRPMGCAGRGGDQWRGGAELRAVVTRKRDVSSR